MSDPAAFLRAIIAHPDDDGPRLVYADWLDERGDHRGEFIRVQCELAAHPFTDGHDEKICTWCAYNDCDVVRLRDRGHALLEAHGVGWATPLAHALGLTHPRGDFGREGGNNLRGVPFRWGWRRGFVETISLPEWWFMATAKRVFNLTPVRAVTLTDRQPANMRGQSGGRSRTLGWWRDPVGREEPSRIHAEIFSRLKPKRSGNMDVRRYPSTAEALGDLSHACVAYGRSLVKSTSQVPSF